VRETTDVVKLGDKTKVKIIAIDPANGKVKLSRRQALSQDELNEEMARLNLQAASAPDGPPREGGFRHDGPPRRDGGFRDRGPRRDGPGGGHGRR
jgi:polyribonucleotide nucleotidyltransferase